MIYVPTTFDEWEWQRVDALILADDVLYQYVKSFRLRLAPMEMRVATEPHKATFAFRQQFWIEREMKTPFVVPPAP